MRKRSINKTVVSVVSLICVTIVLCSVIFISANVDIFGVIKSKFMELTGNTSGYYIEGPMKLNDVNVDEQRQNWMDVAEKALPTVVYIENYGAKGNSAGSGIIMTTDGYIVTNYHVIEDAMSLYVELYDDTRFKANLVGGDKYTDLAVIKIDAVGLKAAEFGNSDALRAAEPVLAVGNPGGSDFKFSVTEGIVSALNRPMDLGYGYTVFCIQTDAAINPGNSGGALFNQYGQVVGINSAKIIAEGFEGLGFAISTKNAMPIVNTLCEKGSVERAILGITASMLSDGTVSGLLIASITNQSIKDAGLVKGDVITKIENHNITSTSTVNSILQYKKPGDVVTIEYTRAVDGTSVTAKIKLASTNN